MDSEWIYFTPNLKDIYKIDVYDDGNQVYEQYVNKWAIYGKWRGKCSIINVENQLIKITSISSWKISRI
jgi:hypothetical protein